MAITSTPNEAHLLAPGAGGELLGRAGQLPSNKVAVEGFLAAGGDGGQEGVEEGQRGACSSCEPVSAVMLHSTWAADSFPSHVPLSKKQITHLGSKEEENQTNWTAG